MLRQGLELAIDYGRHRHIFGQLLNQHQGLNWMLTDAVMDYEAAQALTEQATQAIEHDNDDSLAAAHTKNSPRGLPSPSWQIASR